MNKLAIVQAPPVFLDLKRSIERACEYINQAANSSADLVMFPEAYLPGYPSWVWRLKPGGEINKCKDLHHELVRNSVDLSRDGLARIQQVAKQCQITTAIGFQEINAEASGSTLYCAYALIGPDGEILNRHRKLIPTNPERMVWGWGDARGLNVVATGGKPLSDISPVRAAAGSQGQRPPCNARIFRTQSRTRTRSFPGQTSGLTGAVPQSMSPLGQQSPARC